MIKKALVIFNPSAGLNTKIDIESLVREKLLASGYQVDLFFLNQEFEANIDSYDFSGVVLVAAVGGDGTQKVAARTMITNNIEAPLLIIPFGSANVLANSLGLPLSVKEALEVLDSYKKVKIDVGIINRLHYFLVGFSLGYISQIVIGTSRQVKNKLGPLGYVWNFIFNTAKLRRIKFKISTRNKTFWIKGNSLIVFNAFNLFGIKTKKDINSADGVLNLYVMTSRQFLYLLRVAWQMIWYERPPKHIFDLDNSYFCISVKKKKHLKTAQIDGDKISLPNKIEIETLPKALEVLVKA